MANVELQICIDDEVVQTIKNADNTPTPGEFLDIPDVRFGGTTWMELFVGKVTRRYPLPGQINQQTIVRCECSNV